MNNTNGQAWKTKYGPRRVRHELPTLSEAIAAAQGLTDELDQQAEIAASLMGLPLDEVQEVLLKLPRQRKKPLASVAFTGSASAPRTVLVERKPTRRISAAAQAQGLGVMSRPRTSASR